LEGTLKRIATHLPLAGLIALVAVALGVVRPFEAGAQGADRPNVVLILTDDQALDEMRALPRTTALIGGQGVTFDRAYISYPLCCPSRASIYSGQYMHNHRVRGNSLPYGSWNRFEGLGTEDRALPVWLRDAGYHNVFIGKYMNGYGGGPAPIPPGWDEWYGKYSEYDTSVYGGGIYFNYTMREDPPAGGGVPCPGAPPNPGGAPVDCAYGQSADDYQTDVFTRKAVEAIHRVAGGGPAQAPFFLSVDFNAPHSPYIPAPRHAGTFAGFDPGVPAGENEPNVRDKPRFLRRLPKLGRGKLIQIDRRRQARLEMLLSVDEGVEAIVDALRDEGELDNTYLVFMSDNGYFSGEHRIRQGKFLPHEPSSHVPLMIRGPGIPAGAASSELVSNVDLAPTISEIAGATPTLREDGRSLLPFAQSPALRSGRPLVFEGDTGPGIDDDGAETPSAPADPADAKRLRRYHKKVKAKKRKIRRRCRKLKRKSPKRVLPCYRRGVRNIEQEPTDTTYKLRAPAYRGIRTDRYALHLYATGEVELYDMALDPYQLASRDRAKRYRKVRKWLLAKLNVYGGCAGAACNAALGPDPVPLKPKKKKKKRKRGR
jgi:arylsulfatase A-like enzyme